MVAVDSRGLGSLSEHDRGSKDESVDVVGHDDVNLALAGHQRELCLCLAGSLRMKQLYGSVAQLG